MESNDLLYLLFLRIILFQILSFEPGLIGSL